MPGSVRIALKAAGENRCELEKVIGRYNLDPADSMKLRAAYFLTGNMPGKFYYEGELLDAYSQYVKLISADQGRNKIILDSISGIYGPMSVSRLEIKEDLKELKAEFLIKNIDMAFKVWQEQPWGKDICFDKFCEYILPYRVGDERPEYDRREIYNNYNSLLDSVRICGGTAIDACSAINNELIKEGWEFTHDFSFLPRFPACTLLKYRKGNCREMTATAIFIMRALGIPVTSDFTPQWANRSLGHEWNVVLDREGKNHVFMGSSSNPGSEGQNNVFNAMRPVVYRKLFAIQPQSLAMLKKKNEIVPQFFENPLLKDVSEEYFRDYTSSIPLNKKESGAGFAYACVFNNSTWVPVTWGKIIKGKAVFPKLASNILYLPAYYTRNKELLPGGDPFIITQDGEEKYIKAVESQKKDMLLRRKYPLPW
jgi:hypothetical protein